MKNYFIVILFLFFSANTFASSYIENLGNSDFKISPLDNMAQLSSVKSIIIEDFDADGNLDLYVAQNFFGPAGFMSAYTYRRGYTPGSCGTG